MEYNQSNSYLYRTQDNNGAYSWQDGQEGWHGMPYYRTMPQPLPYGRPGMPPQPPYGQPGMVPPYQPSPVPYHMAYPYPVYMQGEDDDERDLERLQSMFPQAAKTIQPLVEDACDRMEYDGSLMFDEYPDQRMMERMVEEIFKNIEQASVSEQSDAEGRDELFETQCRNCGNRRGDGFRDLISVMLYEEMHRRRCRRRRCKRWW